MKNKYTLGVVALLLMLPMLTGCWTMAAAGAGAYGGYQMKKEGYTLQNPVTKEEDKKKSTK
ncbi:MAG: hypothetical protein DYH15_06790 [Nitrosomonas sp. PRO4]|nr:hypothetical protein [Nitrosomonas sp. PRO4]